MAGPSSLTALQEAEVAFLDNEASAEIARLTDSGSPGEVLGLDERGRGHGAYRGNWGGHRYYGGYRLYPGYSYGYPYYGQWLCESYPNEVPINGFRFTSTDYNAAYQAAYDACANAGNMNCVVSCMRQ
jgi:hypothetical protein